ncbi:pentatricopeptide repeat-containing protein At1g09410, mitochondrial-like [Selaginella moellendorffii]|uniref:pentatricopeptide repeat-containing protein At1g09410, mitochondrial-like n=1 Tax=Selaginella moellendorffii TaxID=88036 RepID=UPI000D1D0000|nr:pentatricopeptide repeat-containing protein At1g09410, mitochondrial-like [Selaginella moellendorffii]|eukprot:XP_024536586.1 pentatricopeptide repeat-containing protein At1g09410, mitochondrial-like [Selaginella moellendorffii]
MPWRDIVSWTTIVAAAAQYGYLEESLRLPYCMPGQLEEARIYFETMPEQNTVSLCALISAYARMGHLDEARQFSRAAHIESTEIKTAMVSAFAENGCVLEAKYLFESGTNHDLVSWTAFMTAFALNGHFCRCGSLFLRMPERDVVAWTTLLAAYAHNGRSDEALYVFHSMNAMDVSVDGCFGCALVACSHVGSVYAARSCFVSIEMDFHVQPVKLHFRCMIDVLGRAGYLHSAQELLKTMPFEPETVDWKCLLGACRSYRSSVEFGNFVAKNVIDKDPRGATGYVLAANMMVS